MSKVMGLLGVGLLTVALAGCGDDESPTTAVAPPSQEPSHVESDTCRANAGSLLDDAESASSMTEAAQVQRYAGSIETASENLDCSAGVLSSLIDVVDSLSAFHDALAQCEMYDKWFTFRDDGQPDEDGTCTDADGPFAALKSGIVEARTLVELTR